MAGTSLSSRWIRRFHPAPQAATRLVYLPHAGGSATSCFQTSRALAPDVDVLAVQYPGRQDRINEPCITEISTLADRIVDELNPWLDRPVTLFGHSMGSTVAYEVALRLERRGVVPLGLFASGRRAPSVHRDPRVRLGSDEDLLADLKLLSGTDDQVFADEALVRMILPPLRGDYHAIETYRPEPGSSLTCPVIALSGDDDPVVELDEVALWERHTSASFRMRVFSGGHFFIDGHLPAITQEIRDHIAAASGPRTDA
ncbi:alpha/beta fold hydrolase [Streptomyces sp. NPDC020719]|uniref:thioesterase II family protein n=1 Tax=unclassified Streptomyces TaxID=2593676 RepID=UPI0033C3B11E